ncbi:MAG: zinc-binding dehydrogenase [Anaerolinea sp.]|nr:zinc-binding dehydrogenase [Anaerolinea sp.]
MKASVFYEHGGREVLRIVTDLPIPEPGPGEVRLRMGAIALNRLDLWVREGWPGLHLTMPHITSSDGAGTIDALGPGVTDWQIGERVGINPTYVDPAELLRWGREEDVPKIQILGEDRPGVAAEYVCLHTRHLIRLPSHISFEQSAAAGLVYITAWHSLITRGGLRPGETVLIVGAGGGVNSASIQIARYTGAHVIVVGSTAEKCEQALRLGAHSVIDRSAEPAWSKAVYKLTDKRGVDVVVDNVGAATIFDSIRSLKRGGRVLIVGNTSGPQAQIDLRYLFGRNLTIIGSSMGTTRDFQTVMGLVFSGALQPVIGATLPLDQIAEGHRLLEEGSVFGKVVLTL